MWGASTFPAGPFRVITSDIGLSTRDNMKIARKPRSKETGTLIGVRLQAQPLAALDAYVSAQPEPKPTRPEAIRYLLQDSLTGLGYLPARDDPEMAN